MFDDLIKKKKWQAFEGVVFVDCNSINKNKTKPVWDIKHHKQTRDTWYAPAGFINKKKIVVSSNGRKAAR